MKNKTYNFIKNQFQVKNLLRLTGILLLLFILSRVNLVRLKNTLFEVSLPLYTVALLISFPMIFFRSLRWNLLLRSFDQIFSFVITFFYYLIGAVGLISPGRLGEFIKVFYLKEHQTGTSLSIISVIIDRLFDVIVMSTVASLAIIQLVPAGDTQKYIFSGLLSLGLLVFIALLLTQREFFWTTSLTILRKLVPDRFGDNIDDLEDELTKMGTSNIYLIFLAGLVLSVSVFLLQVLRLQYIAWTIGLEPNFFWLAGVVSIMSLVNLIPITISGIGTRDAILIYFFTGIGVAKSSALAFSILILISHLIFGVFGSVLLVVYPPDINIKSFLAET